MEQAGVKSEPFPRSIGPGSQGGTNGQIVLVAIALQAGDVITGIMFEQDTLPTTTTLFKVGLYDSTFTRVAVSNDASAAVIAGPVGLRTVAFTGPYTVPTDGIYYAAMIQVGSTVSLNYMVASGDGANQMKAVNGGKALAGAVNAQADLVAGPLAPNFALISNLPWLAAY